MTGITTGAGLAALGFWLFVAGMVVVGVWSAIRKRDAEHETLRRIVESGQPVDETLVDKILEVTGGSQDLERDLKVAAWILFSIAPGLVALGLGLSTLTAELLWVLTGVGALVAFIGSGCWMASRLVRKWYVDSDL